MTRWLIGLMLLWWVGMAAAEPSSYGEFTDIPKVDYSGISDDELKQGEFLPVWEKRLAADVQSRLGAMQLDDASQQRARSLTYERYSSTYRPHQVVLILMADSTWTYPILWKEIEERYLPSVMLWKGTLRYLGVSVKRNLTSRKHIVLIMETEGQRDRTP